MLTGGICKVLRRVSKFPATMTQTQNEGSTTGTSGWMINGHERTCRSLAKLATAENESMDVIIEATERKADRSGSGRRIAEILY